LHGTPGGRRREGGPGRPGIEGDRTLTRGSRISHSSARPSVTTPIRRERTTNMRPTRAEEGRRGPAVPGRLEAALARAETSEAMYRSLVASLPAITYAEALDDGRTLSISPQIEALLGCSQAEWMADP